MHHGAQKYQQYFHFFLPNIFYTTFLSSVQRQQAMVVVHGTILRKRETKEAQVKESCKLELVDNVQVAAIVRKRRKKRFENGETTGGKKRRRNKEGVCSKATDEDAEKVKVENLPLPVLEKIFSYLDWKDLGTAMLVCKSWKEVGGHPSLWTEFPLKLKGFRPHWTRLRKFIKIRRLGWVKSVTITLEKRKYSLPIPAFEETLKPLTRLEELFLFFRKFVHRRDIRNDFMKIQAANNNRLVRICAFYPRLFGASESHYFVTNCDAGTNAFIKRTLAFGGPKDESNILINGLTGVQLSNQVAETLCTNLKKPISRLETNLMIDQNINLEKLECLLKHVESLYWRIDVKDCDNQAVAPINAILDLLDSKDHGKFLFLLLPKELLLKSNCVERLGGRANVEAFITDGSYCDIKRSKTGLKMVDEESEDEGSEDEESEDKDEEEDGDDGEGNQS